MSDKTRVAVLDDYQNVALQMADRSVLDEKIEITVFNDHIADEARVISRLLPFTIVCVMRERTPLTRQILSQLPNLKLIVSTGKRNASIDAKAAGEFGIEIKPTG
jgi:lactate dehydrogenase-like 2-hydroxyacid dehydrogenase